MTSVPPEASTPPARATRSEEVGRAFTNALRLGSSLILTWTIALVVRFFVPRHFGPALFGTFNLADAITLSAFTLLSLGIDQHIQITVAVDKKAANAYLGTIAVLRAAMSVLVFAGVAGILHWNGRPLIVQRMGFILGIGYLFNGLTSSFASVLMASGSVGAMSAVNVLAKLAWGAGIAGVLFFGGSVEWLAIVFTLSETGRLLAVRALARREAGYAFQWNPEAGRKALKASLPFYMNTVAIIVYGKIDVNTMMALTTDTEIGWYSSAANVASLALLLAPVTQWVLGPMMARAAKYDPAELWFIVRRTTEGVLILSIPIVLLIALGADLLVKYILGASFVPATTALRVLAPMFVFTYIAMTTATALNLVNRGWTVATISSIALLTNPAMNYFIVPYCSRTLGPGGAGVGAAITLVSVEAIVTVTLLTVVGRASVDRRLFAALFKSLIGCAAALVVHRLATPLGPFRLVADMATYTVVALGLGVISRGEIVSLIKVVRSRGAARVPT